MQIKGEAIKLGDNINTDFIISGRYKFSITDIKELSQHIMEDIDPGFPKRVISGKSIIVAGKNFGMGSSREQAPLVIKECGIVCVLAKSFGRIFYRNGFNIGLPLVDVDTDGIVDGDILKVDLTAGVVSNLSQNTHLQIRPLPEFMLELLREGGAVGFIKKHPHFNLKAR